MAVLLFTMFNGHAKGKTPGKSQGKAQDTNIICYAANNKWVCANTEAQAQAKLKAQRLQQQAKQDGEVEIKTLKLPSFQISEQNRTQNSKTKQNSKPKPNIKKAPPATKKPAIASHKTQSSFNLENYQHYWTYQLIGVSTENSARKFKQNLTQSQQPITIFKTVRDDTDWWIVTYGIFQNKAQALQYDDELPNTHTKAWLRPLKSLQVVEILNDN